MLEHKCEVCGRMWRKKLKANGKIVCNKHYMQFKKHKKFLDNSPRTPRDKNNITIDDDIAYIDLYNKKYEVIAQAIIDKEDINKVKYIKWRLNHNGYVYNNSNTSTFLHRRILDTDQMVDHINGDRLDNRKSNLRICNHSTNQMNVNYKGVSELKNGKWNAYIKRNGKMVNLGNYVYECEALYARWYAERIIFGEFAYDKEEPKIFNTRKKEIKKLVKQKVQRL